MSKPNKNIFKSLVLEIRPRLQSVNVLVSLIEPISNVSVVLNDDNFEIVSNQSTYLVNCKLHIVQNSLSSLIVADGYISFRFATQGCLDDWGGFKTELLKINEPKISQSNVYTTFLDKANIFSVSCRNCEANLVESVQFERILPLPSENSEPSDWFCHNHSHEDGQNNATFNLDPKETDVFFTNTYFHLIRKLVWNVRETGDILICRRCLSWLGLVKNSQTVQFWFNTVSFEREGVKLYTHSLNDTFKVIKEVLNNVLFNSAKIILICKSSVTQIDYILLWILEKQLSVQFSSIKSDSEGENCVVAKVLFRYENGCTELVQSWENETNISSVGISKSMFVEILKYLYSFNKVFPREFSKSNQFYISYLKMYNEL